MKVTPDARGNAAIHMVCCTTAMLVYIGLGRAGGGGERAASETGARPSGALIGRLRGL